MDKTRWQAMLDEVAALEEYDRQQYERERIEAQRQEMVNADECVLSDNIIGKLSELPMWAQGYIKHLRGQIPAEE